MSITQNPCVCNTENNFFSKEVFCANLRSIRGEKTQEEMGRLVGIGGQQQWQRLEKGTTEPNLTVLVRMSKLFNKPVGVLLGVESESEFHATEAGLLDGLRAFRSEMEAGIARANAFLESIDKLEKKLGTMGGGK